MTLSARLERFFNSLDNHSRLWLGLCVELGRMLTVGGVGPSDFAAYVASGISGFGLGSSLFSVTASREDVIARGKDTAESYDEARRAG